MKQWLVFATEYAIIIIDALALVIIVVGTVEAFFGGLHAMFASPSGHERRDIWLRYARWLVAGLTFQLAADIIETSITTEWQAVGRIAAIALIRTFLNYFLDRDLEDVRRRHVRLPSNVLRRSEDRTMFRRRSLTAPILFLRSGASRPERAEQTGKCKPGLKGAYPCRRPQDVFLRSFSCRWHCWPHRLFHGLSPYRTGKRSR